MKLMPGSPFNDAKLNAEQKEILNEKYGLNDPVATQYLHYLKMLLQAILVIHSNIIINLCGI